MSEDLKLNEATQETAVSRREFGAVSLAAGLAVVAGAGAAEAAEGPLTETEVTVKTPDGNCDAAFIHPTTGTFPGVLIWPDAFGLRPAMRQIGRRIASEGYAVLVPNPFYRTAKAPVFDNPSAFDFSNPADTAKLPPLTGPLQAAGAAEKDAVAYVAFLDAQKEVDKTKKIGTQGYCMGGALVVRTAAAAADRIGAGASFHGGGLVTDNPNSPHLLAPKIKARMYFGIAANDDMRQPDANSPSGTRGKSRMHKGARTDPCGGRGVTRAPTATKLHQFMAPYEAGNGGFFGERGQIRSSRSAVV